LLIKPCLVPYLNFNLKGFYLQGVPLKNFQTKSHEDIIGRQVENNATTKCYAYHQLKNASFSLVLDLP
jgi:hypothetical protein